MFTKAFKVSVIVPTYNSERYIRQTIDSIINQSYPKELLEIIIINDGSTDGTANIISEYGKDLKVINSANKGVSHARNIGIKAATGDYIQFLDADDLLHPEKIELQISTIKESKILPSFICSKWAKIKEDSNMNNLNQIYSQIPNLTNLPIGLIATDNFIPLMSGLVKTDVAKEIEGFDIEMSHIEDVNFLVRLYIANNNFLCCEGNISLFYYRVVKASASTQNLEAFLRGIYKNCDLLMKSFGIKKHKLLLTNYWIIYLNSILNNYTSLSKTSSDQLSNYSINSSRDFKFKIYKLLGPFIFELIYKHRHIFKTK